MLRSACHLLNLQRVSFAEREGQGVLAFALESGAGVRYSAKGTKMMKHLKLVFRCQLMVVESWTLGVRRKCWSTYGPSDYFAGHDSELVMARQRPARKTRY
jgi:hypothetical protein